MKRERGNFRGNCLAAKGRLGGGFWVQAMERRDKKIMHAAGHGQNSSEVITRFISQLRNTVQHQHDNSEEDEQFYNKIRAVLTVAPNSNPLSGVLDREYMMTLGDAERERYVFSLSTKVRHCIDRFNQENELNICV